MGSTPAFSNTFSTFYSTLDRKLLIKCSDKSELSKKLSDNQTFWDWMSETMKHFNQCMENLKILHDDGTLQDVKEQIIPFDFRLGMVGYFGYEMKRESLPNYTIPTDQQYHQSSYNPDSAFIFTTQAIIFDHLEKQMWLAGLVDKNLVDKNHMKVNYLDNELRMHAGLSYADYEWWTTSIEKQLCDLKSSSEQTSLIPDMVSDAYIRAIEKARSFIHEGQSYELCLTTQFRANLPERLDHNW